MLAPSEDDSPPAGLAEFLQAMAAEGAVSSSGVFTIDVRAALPKLEKFQLPRPHFGLLKVIQSAIGSGASFVSTNFSSAAITIEHDGQPPEPDQLRDLLSYLLSTDASAGDRSLRDLAIGVNTSLARGAAWVEVSARTPEGVWACQRWASREETSQTEQYGWDGQATVRFEVRRTLGQAAKEVLGWGHKDIAGLVFGRRDVMDEDARAVYDRCRHAPVPVRINGRIVPPSHIGRQVTRRWSPLRTVQHRRGNIAEILLLCDQESPHLLSPPPESQARHRFVIQGRFDGEAFLSEGELLTASSQPLAARRCFGVVAIRGRAQVPGEMTVVKDGVDLARLTPPGLPKGVSVLLTAEGLRLDLSQFRLVDGEHSRQRLAWLSRLVEDSARQLLARFSALEWSPGDLHHLQRLAPSPPREPG